MLKSLDDPLLVAHNSSLIDLQFRQNFTSNSPLKPQPGTVRDVSNDTSAFFFDDPLRPSEEAAEGTMEEERFLDVQCVEFDWLFVSEYAETFMKSVEQNKNMELF